MRPKSAYHSTKKNSKNPRTYTNIGSSSASRKLQTSQSREWQIKVEQLKVCNDPKTIPLIHAYQPQRLKQCLVKNPKAYKKFYQTHGSCTLSKMYTSSFLTHLKEWKRSIKQRIMNVLEMVFESDQIQAEDEENRVNSVLREITNITQELQQCSKTIAENKKESSNQSRSLLSSFQLLQQYIVHIQNMLNNLYSYNRQLNQLMDTGIERYDIKEIQKNIRKIHRTYEKRILQSLRYCSTHPESSNFNRVEYKMKVKFDSIAKELISSLEKIQKLRKLKEHFKLQIQQLTTSSYDDEDCSIRTLEEIASVLAENEHNRLSLGDKIRSYKALEIITRLEQEIRQDEEEFLIKFKYRSLLLIKKQNDNISQAKVISSMKDQGKEIKKSKKKLLLLAKIYSKNNAPEYHQTLSDCIHSTSEHYQNLQQVLQLLISMSKDRKFQSRSQISNTLAQLLHPIQLFDKQKKQISNQLLQTLIESSFQVETNPKQYASQSQKIKRLMTILQTSDNKTKSLLKIRNHKHEIITIEQMNSKLQQANNYLQELSTQYWPKMLEYSYELKMLMKDELIQTLLLFEEDLNKQQIHGFELLNQFYHTMYKTKKQKSITPSISKQMIQYYKSTIEQCQLLQNKQQMQQFVTFIFINKIIQHCLPLLGECSAIMKKNSTYKPNTINYNPQTINNTLNIMNNFHTGILPFSTVSEYSLFIQTQTKKLQTFTHKQTQYQQFDNSTSTGSYYPSGQTLLRWIQYQFSYHIDKTQSPQTIKKVRKSYNDLFNKNIQKLMQLQLENKNDDDFVQAIKQKINLINNFLIAGIKDKQYSQIVSRVCTYLRQSKIYHIGLCTKSNEPITFILQKCEFQQIIRFFQYRLGLDEGTIERNKNIFEPINPQTLMKQLIDTYGASFIIGQPEKTQNKPIMMLLPEKPKKQEAVQEEMVEEIEEKEMGEEIEEMKEQIQEKQEEIEEAMFILEQKKQVKEDEAMFILDSKEPQENKGMFVLQDNKQSISEEPLFIYYKIQKVNNMESLGSSLSFYRTEAQSVTGQLKIQHLALAFQQQQPQPLLKEHLQQVLQSSSKSNLITIFNSIKKYSRTQQLVHELIEALPDKKKRLQNVKKILQAMNIEYEIVYEGNSNDKIIMFDMRQKGHYCHLILNDPQPFKNSYISTQTLQSIEQQMWKSLLSEKNSNIDQVHRHISTLNEQIDAKNDEVVDRLCRCKQFPMFNGDQVDDKLNQYVEERIKPNKRVTLMTTIDIFSFYDMLTEFQAIPCLNKFKCNLVCNEQIIYSAENYDQIIKFIKDYALLPQAYINAHYIERRNIEEVQIKLNKIINHLLKQLKLSKPLTLQQITKALRSEESEIKSQIENKKLQLKNNQTQQINQFISILQQHNQLENKLSQAQTQISILQYILQCHAKPSTQPLNEEEFQQMQSFSFVMSSTRQPQYSVQFYEKLCQLLDTLNIKHRKMIYHNRIIGVVEHNSSIEDAIGQTLSITNVENISAHLQNDNVIVEKLWIQLTVGEMSQKQKLFEFIEYYGLQIHNGKCWENYKLLLSSFQDYIHVQCLYPKKPITIQLKENNKILHKLQLKNYSYGKKYLIKKITTILKNKLQMEQLKEEERKRKLREERLQAEREAIRKKLQEDEIIRLKQQAEKQERERIQQKIQEERKKIQEKKKQEEQEQELRMKQQENKLLLQNQEKRREQEQKKQQQNKQEEKVEKNESSQFYVSYLPSQGWEPQTITFIPIDEQKMRKYSSDTEEVSIILSEAKEFNRQELIQMNPNSFEDVHEIIERVKRDRTLL